MIIVSLLASLLLIGIDQALKLWAIRSLTQVSTIPLIQDVLHLTYVENRGAAFNIFNEQKWFLIGITSLIALATLTILLSGKIKNRFLMGTLALIFAGGVGNLVDRIRLGYVVDYIDFRLINFAVFNFADCCVVVGTILFAIYVLFFDEGQNSNAKQIEQGQQPEENNAE